MSILVPLTLFGWIPAVLAMFALLPARRAVIAAYIGGWLFLPMAGYNLPGLPDYTKTSATTLGVMLAISVFDANRLANFKPRWFDLPILVWCLCPFAASISNGLGAYDGLSAVVEQTIHWGLPYLTGRLYLTDEKAFRDLAVGVFIGGLIYMPLCLYEIRMSPQLHNLLYGFVQTDFIKAIRYGGYRPRVFMQTGLAVGLWMSLATLTGFWLWRSGTLRRIWGVPTGTLLLVMAITTVLCKSVYAILLGFAGMGMLLFTKWFTIRWAVLMLVLIPPIYITLRTTSLWSGQQAVTFAEKMIGEGRAQSLQVRLEDERILRERALKKPIWGWGRWGRMRPPNEKTEVVTDGMWILALGRTGLVGVTSFTAALLLPVVLVIRAIPPQRWSKPYFAPVVVVGIAVLLYMLDNLLNAMVNPIYMVMAGGLLTFAGSHQLSAIEYMTLYQRNLPTSREGGGAASLRPSPEEVR